MEVGIHRVNIVVLRLPWELQNVRYDSQYSIHRGRPLDALIG